MRDYEKEFTDRVAFIRQLLAESGAAGIVYGNSGGKDSALVGILCKAACENTVGQMCIRDSPAPLLLRNGHRFRGASDRVQA